MKKSLVLFWVVLVAVAGFFMLNSYIYNEKQGDQKPATTHKDATYVVGAQVVNLVSGISEVEAAPGSMSKTVTRYFGNEASFDFNGDGRNDIVFLLTQNAGGSGTFYYVVASLNKEDGYEGSQAFLIGDRIAPQTTHIDSNGIVVVNYADRKPEENFTVMPSVGKSLRLKFDQNTMAFTEIKSEQGSSGATLDMKSWTWVKALYNDGREVMPKDPSAFVLTFGRDGKFSLKTDCNSVGGSYTTVEDMLIFADIFSTKMFCEGSQENTMIELLRDTSMYHFTEDGGLILDLKFDGGSVVFK